MYADSYPPSITLAFPAWFSAQAAPFPLLGAAVQVAASGPVSPLFGSSSSAAASHRRLWQRQVRLAASTSSQQGPSPSPSPSPSSPSSLRRQRALLAASSSQLGISLGVLLDSSATGLVIDSPGSFNGSTAVSGGTLLAAFGSRLPFSLLPCAAGQIPNTGSASGCGVSAQDSGGVDLSGALVALQLPPSMALTAMPLSALAFPCDAQSAMEGQCLPGGQGPLKCAVPCILSAMRSRV